MYIVVFTQEKKKKIIIQKLVGIGRVDDTWEKWKVREVQMEKGEEFQRSLDYPPPNTLQPSSPFYSFFVFFYCLLYYTL